MGTSLVDLLNDRTVVALSTAIALIGFIWPELRRRYRIAILALAVSILVLSVLPFGELGPVFAAARGVPTAQRSYIDPGRLGCRWAVTYWSDGTMSAVPLTQPCPNGSQRTNSAARLVRVYNQLTDGREWAVAQWSDWTYTCALRGQPEGALIVKPDGCTW